MRVFLITLLTFLSIEIQNNVVFSHYYSDKVDEVNELILLYESNVKLMKLWGSVIAVESCNGLYTFNKAENAVGIAQIRPIMIEEVNRLLGENRYSHEQAWNDSLSFCIFRDYQDKVNPSYDLEIGSRLWNGGLSGMNKQSTIKYYQKILNL